MIIFLELLESVVTHSLCKVVLNPASFSFFFFFFGGGGGGGGEPGVHYLCMTNFSQKSGNQDIRSDISTT